MKLFTALLTISTFVYALPPARESELLLQASAHASAHSPSDAAELSALREIFQTSDLPANRVTAAYLLSLSAQVSETEQTAFVQFVSDHPAELALLGKNAQLRIDWLHAEAAYENGDFEAAARDYRLVEASAPAELAAYATLKLGWCALNRHQSKEAFEVFQDAIARGQHRAEAATFLAFWRGLGEALIEWGAPSAGWNALRRLRPSADEAASMADGVIDALFARDASQVRPLALGAEKLAWRGSLASAVLQRAKAAQKPACSLLSWYELAPTGEAESDVLSDCLAIWESGHPPSNTDQEILRNALRELDLRGGGRELRLRRFALVKDDAAYCKEGLLWMSERGPVFPPPVAEIADACGKSAQVEAVTKALLEAGADRLQHANDPFVFLAARLSHRPEFRTAVITLVEKHQALFQDSPIPRLLAERTDEKAALALWKTYGAKQTSDEAWNGVALRNLSELLKRKDGAGALQLLQSELPLDAEKAPSSLTARAWYLFLTSDLAPPAAREKATTVLLKNRAAFPEFVPAVVESACHDGQWSDLWSLFDREPALTKETRTRALTCLFDALADGKASLPANTKDAEAVAAAEVAKFDLKAKTSGSRPWEKDLRFLQSLDQAATKRPVKDPVHAVQALIASLQKNKRQLQKHTWSHPRFVEASRQWLSAYCETARGRLAALQSASDEPAWHSALAEVDGKFAQCAGGTAR